MNVMKTRSKRVCRMKVTLRHTRPPVWRRFEVTDDTTFARLHQVLQRVMGWTDSHLHAFRVGDDEIGVPDPEADCTNEKSVRGVRYPRCVAGKRACPPEDCGGALGHQELIEILADPDHERYEEMRAWAGEWEPERFDPDAMG